MSPGAQHTMTRRQVIKTDSSMRTSEGRIFGVSISLCLAVKTCHALECEHLSSFVVIMNDMKNGSLIFMKEREYRDMI